MLQGCHPATTHTFVFSPEWSTTASVSQNITYLSKIEALHLLTLGVSVIIVVCTVSQISIRSRVRPFPAKRRLFETHRRGPSTNSAIRFSLLSILLLYKLSIATIYGPPALQRAVVDMSLLLWDGLPWNKNQTRTENKREKNLVAGC